MKKTFQYILNEKLNVNGRQIYCKVTGDSGSANDNRPYVLVISGGPGFGHELTEAYIQPLLPIADKEKGILPHFIFFDHLGCGQSDKAIDPDMEYTVDNFTDLAAALVEAIKKKLNLAQMNLYVEGGSFGSLVAMNFPARKPDWLDSNSVINIKQITAKVVPNGSDMADYAFKFLHDHYAEHPNYDKIVVAQQKLFTGTIQNKTDYVQNFVLPMASLYAKDVNKSLFNRVVQRIVTYYPNAVIKVLDLANRLCKKFGIEIASLNFADTMLGKCSLDVLNHFFRTNFKGFNLLETVKKKKDLYQKIPICLISASEDHVCDYRLTESINELLRDSSAAIIFKEPHMLSKGPSREIYNKLNYDLLVTGDIPNDDVNHLVIIHHTVGDDFNNLLSAAHQHQSNKLVMPLSTAKLLSAMPEQTAQNWTLDNLEVVDEVVEQQHSPDPVSPIIAKLDMPVASPALTYSPII